MTANKSYFLFLWMRYKWIAMILVTFNIATIACAVFDQWTDWLYMVPGLTLILWGKSDANRWDMAYKYLCRLCQHTTHFGIRNGKVTDGDLQGAEYFVKMYPWTEKCAQFEIVRVGPNEGILYMHFTGNGKPWTLEAGNGTKPLTKSELSNLMKMCK